MSPDSASKKHAACLMQSLATLSVAQAYQCWCDGSALLVDVRHPGHFMEVHVSGAILLNDSCWSTFLAQVMPTIPVMVMCYHGISSKKVAYLLLQQGFSTVYNIQGGFSQWAAYYPHTIVEGS